MPTAVRANPRGFRFPIKTEFSGTLQNAGHTRTQVRLQIAAPGGGGEVDQFFCGWGFIYLKNGPAAGEFRRIVSFLTATDDVLVDEPFRAVPTGDLYSIVTVLTNKPVIFAAAAGGADYVDLPVAAGIRNDFWSGCPVELIGGVGGNIHRPVNQRTVRDYDGAARRLYVDRPWDLSYGGLPDATTIVKILGHLYSPMTSFDGKLATAGATFRYSGQPGGIATGIGLPSDKIDESVLPTLASYLEIASDADDEFVASRWE